MIHLSFFWAPGKEERILRGGRKVEEGRADVRRIESKEMNGLREGRVG